MVCLNGSVCEAQDIIQGFDLHRCFYSRALLSPALIYATELSNDWLQCVWAARQSSAGSTVTETWINGAFFGEHLLLNVHI